MMRLLGGHRFWFSLAALLTVLALFVFNGATGGLVAFAACAAFIFGVFRRVRDAPVEDRTAGTGMFGGGF
jgi:hypothetical protein